MLVTGQILCKPNTLVTITIVYNIIARETHAIVMAPETLRARGRLIFLNLSRKYMSQP